MSDKKISEKENKKEIKNSEKKEKLELNSEIETKKKKLLDLKIDFKLGKVKNTSEIRKLRKEIARMLTKKSLNRFISDSKEQN